MRPGQPARRQAAVRALVKARIWRGSLGPPAFGCSHAEEHARHELTGESESLMLDEARLEQRPEFVRHREDSAVTVLRRLGI